jgi:tetratricopeptide (TPR) repeat protein
MAASNWLTTASERTGIAWGIVTKACLFAIGLFTACVIVWQVVRECTYDGIVMEPVIVKGPAADGAPTVEMATQQIALYIDKIQRTGAHEWRAHDLAESESTGISIQIPGSSLNVETIVRELAGMFPHRRRVLKVSITANPAGSGYVGAIAISQDGPPTRAICPSDDRQGALGRMFECLAVEAMKVVDPLFAASYVLSVEKEQCAQFKGGHPSSITVADEQRRLELLREHCSFAHTRAVVSSIVVRGKAEDQAWVSFIYSKLHLARARALAKIDTEAQWYEFDRAINRFRALSKQEVPASALATQLWAYIRNGLSIQESVLALDWKDGTKAEIIKHRLATADRFLQEAGGRLQHLTDGRQKTSAEAAYPVSPAASSQAIVESADPLGPMTTSMRGIILYRQWMIQAHRRKGDNDSPFAVGREEEKQLEEAVKLFEASKEYTQHKAPLLMQWGNALRALRQFDDAIAKYRQAGDIETKDYAPLLNVAVTLLDKAAAGDSTLKGLQARFDAMRQTSSYLTWVSDGGPFTTKPTLPSRVAAALAGGREADDFAKCRQDHAQDEAPTEVQHMSHTAALKICVDLARDSLAIRVVEEETRSTASLR